MFRPWELCQAATVAGASSLVRNDAEPRMTANDEHVCAHVGTDKLSCSDLLVKTVGEFNSCVKPSTRPSSSTRVDLAGQNDVLIENLFDLNGQLQFHEQCVLRVFGISKGRLRRLQERKLGIRDVHHGLVGRRSNNSKKPETQEQFVQFVRHFLRVQSDTTDKHNVCKKRNGSRLDSIRSQFNEMQQRYTLAGQPRETISRGTTQSWYRMFFVDGPAAPQRDSAKSPPGSAKSNASPVSSPSLASGAAVHLDYETSRPVPSTFYQHGPGNYPYGGSQTAFAAPSELRVRSDWEFLGAHKAYVQPGRPVGATSPDNLIVTPTTSWRPEDAPDVRNYSGSVAHYQSMLAVAQSAPQFASMLDEQLERQRQRPAPYPVRGAPVLRRRSSDSAYGGSWSGHLQVPSACVGSSM